MNEPQQTPQDDAIDVRQLARAMRFALITIVLGLSYVSLRCSLSIGTFELMVQDMLGQEPLPFLTRMVLSARPLLVAVSILVPIVSLATLMFRRVVTSFYVLGVLVLVTAAQLITLYHGMSAPLVQIVSGISGGPTP